MNSGALDNVPQVRSLLERKPRYLEFDLNDAEKRVIITFCAYFWFAYVIKGDLEEIWDQFLDVCEFFWGGFAVHSFFVAFLEYLVICGIVVGYQPFVVTDYNKITFRNLRHLNIGNKDQLLRSRNHRFLQLQIHLKHKFFPLPTDQQSPISVNLLILIDEKNFQEIIMMLPNEGRHNLINIDIHEILFIVVEDVCGLGIGKLDLPKFLHIQRDGNQPNFHINSHYTYNLTWYLN